MNNTNKNLILIAFFLFAASIFAGGCGSNVGDAAPGLSAPASCGVGLLDHDVRIWAEGQDARKACSGITSALRNQGEQPTEWSGQLSSSPNSYQPVCSDSLPTLQYEIVDTGSHSYGTDWCQSIVQEFGSSVSATTPNLFGIISAAEKKDKEENQKQSEEQAVEQAHKQQVLAKEQATCAEVGGNWNSLSLSSDYGDCIVHYTYAYNPYYVKFDDDGNVVPRAGESPESCMADHGLWHSDTDVCEIVASS